MTQLLEKLLLAFCYCVHGAFWYATYYRGLQEEFETRKIKTIINYTVLLSWTQVGLIDITNLRLKTSIYVCTVHLNLDKNSVGQTKS